MVKHREEARLKLQRGQGQLIEWPTGCWQLHEAAREVKRFPVRFDRDRSRRFYAALPRKAAMNGPAHRRGELQ